MLAMSMDNATALARFRLTLPRPSMSLWDYSCIFSDPDTSWQSGAGREMLLLRDKWPWYDRPRTASFKGYFWQDMAVSDASLSCLPAQRSC